MFKQLLKHQLKSTWKEFNISYGVFFLCCIISALFIASGNSHLMIIASIIIAITSLSVIGLLLYLLFKLFYQNTYGKQAYLTFTLPISTHSLIISKTITVLLYTLGYFITIVLSFLGCLAIIDIESIKALIPLLETIIDSYSSNVLATFLLFLQNSLSILSSLIFAHFVCAMSQTFVNVKRKVILVCALLCGLLLVIEIISSFNLIKPCVILDENKKLIIASYDNITINQTLVLSFWQLLLDLIEIFGFYFLTIYVIDKKIEIQ